MFNFILFINVSDFIKRILRGLDFIYVVIVKSFLKAVIFGKFNIIVDFIDGLVLNGITFFDLDVNNFLEGF